MEFKRKFYNKVVSYYNFTIINIGLKRDSKRKLWVTENVNKNVWLHKKGHHTKWLYTRTYKCDYNWGKDDRKLVKVVFGYKKKRLLETWVRRERPRRTCAAELTCRKSPMFTTRDPCTGGTSTHWFWWRTWRPPIWSCRRIVMKLISVCFEVPIVNSGSGHGG